MEPKEQPRTQQASWYDDPEDDIVLDDAGDTERSPEDGERSPDDYDSWARRGWPNQLVARLAAYHVGPENC